MEPDEDTNAQAGVSQRDEPGWGMAGIVFVESNSGESRHQIVMPQPQSHGADLPEQEVLDLPRADPPSALQTLAE